MFKSLLNLLVELAVCPFLFIWALITRFITKKVAVGLGPQPLINNIYHKKALELYGYKAENFANNPYFITDEFDFVANKYIPLNILRILFLTFFSLSRYQCLYFYFNGGPLGATKFLWKIEPYLYKFANINVVIMPYGSDVQDPLRTPNLSFRHVLSADYPKHFMLRKQIQKKIDIWTKGADHIIAGCDWVDYLYHWDTLLLAHFSIDLNRFNDLPQSPTMKKDRPLRILHAPNHREIKGTKFFIQAVEELKDEGYSIDLILMEKKPNASIINAINESDIIADQLHIGWYAMFAIEAMAMKKPVLCYLRQDLIDLFAASYLVKENEIPIIRCDFKNVKEKIRYFCENRHLLHEIGENSRKYIEKYHSIEHIGSIFDKINLSLGIPKGMIT